MRLETPDASPDLNQLAAEAVDADEADADETLGPTLLPPVSHDSSYKNEASDEEVEIAEHDQRDTERFPPTDDEVKIAHREQSQGASVDPESRLLLVVDIQVPLSPADSVTKDRGASPSISAAETTPQGTTAGSPAATYPASVSTRTGARREPCKANLDLLRRLRFQPESLPRFSGRFAFAGNHCRMIGEPAVACRLKLLDSQIEDFIVLVEQLVRTSNKTHWSLAPWTDGDYSARRIHARHEDLLAVAHELRLQDKNNREDIRLQDCCFIPMLLLINEQFMEFRQVGHDTRMTPQQNWTNLSAATDWTRFPRCWAVSFSYRRSWPDDKKSLQDFRRLVRDFHAKCPNLVLIGAMQHHKSGCPHFHVLILDEDPDGPSSDELQCSIRTQWRSAARWIPAKQGGDPFVYLQPAANPLAYAMYSLRKDEHEHRPPYGISSTDVEARGEELRRVTAKACSV